MSDFTIRPTAKFIMVRLIVTALVFLALLTFYLVKWRDKEGMHVVPLVAPIIFVPVLIRAFKRRLTKVTVVGDRLRYESGLAAKTTRTIQLSRIQDVRVDQRPTQRMFAVGDISIETAGETSRLTIPDVDNPQAIADEILNRSQEVR